MQIIKQAVEQLQTNLEQSFSVEQIENKQEVSLYKEGKVSAKCLAENIVLLKQAFPKLPGGFYNVLEKMLDEEKFTDRKLNDAVKNLIKTCQYPEPTIANILGYDKKIKIYTWHELAKMSSDYSPDQRRIFWNDYVAVEFEKPTENSFGLPTRYVLKEYEKFFR